MVCYDPLWITLLKKKMKKKDLYSIASSATVARMGRDEYVSLEVIDKICCTLECNISDVVTVIPNMDFDGKEKDPDV